MGLHPGRPGLAAFPPSLWEIGPRGSPRSTGCRAVRSPRYPRGCDSKEGNGAGVKGCLPVLDQPVRSLKELPFGHDCGSSACALNNSALACLPAHLLPCSEMPAKAHEGLGWVLCPSLKGTIIFQVLIIL